MIHKRYSDFFSTLYDEQEPVGFLGRGTHYSVLRCAEWHDVENHPIMEAQTHDFAIIWDEDHDTRIIYAIEQLYIQGLLAPIQFIGERKAYLSIVVAAKFWCNAEKDTGRLYKEKVSSIAANVAGDHWNLQLGFFDRVGPHHQTELPGMIACTEEQEDTYLRNIDNLWRLGTKKFSPQVGNRSEQLISTPPTY
ncbi:MAG: hypothetical protein ACPGGK_11875 [Pikeienuella sp.]